MPAIHEDRRNRIRALIREAGLDAMLVTNLPDVRWLSGFSGSNAALLVLADNAILATDGRYVTQAGQQCADVELLPTRALATELAKASVQRECPRVGLQGEFLSVRAFEALTEAVPGADLSSAGVPVSAARKVKDEGELDDLRRACAISTEALGELTGSLSIGMSELEIARRLELLMGRLGAEDRSFETIVATGPNSAIPHHDPTQRPIASGDLLKIDFGALFNGYHADCTRTFIVGEEPADWQVEIHTIVRRAQQAGIDALHPGMTGTGMDSVARRVIEAAGFGEYYPHGLGHGVGLEIHEVPFLGPHSANTVEASVPLTVEPGIYLPGRGGVRIEDTMIVFDDRVEILTDFPRDLARVA